MGMGTTMCAVGGFGLVLCMPWRGRYMCPFAVAGHGLRYLRMSFSNMFRHPLRNPLHTTFNSVESFWLDSDWCANLTLLLCICTECMNDARLTPSWNVWLGWRVRSTLGGGHERVDCIPLGVIGNIHKWVDGSLSPLKITFPLYSTSHLWLSNMTQQLALQSGQIPMSDARTKSGTMCPVKMIGRPGIAMSHTCADITFLPLGRFIVNGFEVLHLLTTLMPPMIKMDVALVPALACKVAMVNAFKASCDVGPSKTRAAVAHLCSCICRWVWTQSWEERFDVTPVVSLLMMSSDVTL